MFFLTPSWLKEAKRLSKGVKKFLHHNSDLISAESMGAALAKREEFDAAVKEKDKAAIETLRKPMLDTCEKAVPGYKTDALRENIEVIIVAIIIALGIRAYFLQPFKIPTASMQPTLNGITATQMESSGQFPNAVQRTWEYIWRGRNYTEVKIPDDWGPVRLSKLSQTSKLHFFTVSILTFVPDGGGVPKEMTVYCPARQLADNSSSSGYLWKNPRVADEIRRRIPNADAFTVDLNAAFFDQPGGPLYRPGEVLACGYVDTGDQLLVDKISYNFREPRRGEVFVFSTAGINGIPAPDNNYGSQHYIKRLTGVPGDVLRLRGAPEGGAHLYINGKLAEEKGMQRVMKREDGYPGYVFGTPTDKIPIPFMQGENEIHLRHAHELPQPDDPREKVWDQYLAMGDNGPHSLDSRMWGPVPEKNLVGPALLVYWPFQPHWGWID